jgi:hypothetical protein
MFFSPFIIACSVLWKPSITPSFVVSNAPLSASPTIIGVSIFLFLAEVSISFKYSFKSLSFALNKSIEIGTFKYFLPLIWL